MRSRVTLALAVLSLSFAAFAGPVITSVTPASGPAEGGTAVVIHGSGFSNNCIICSPPFGDPSVTFGDTTAASVHFVDANTIEAVTPPHLPGAVGVTVRQLDGSQPFTLANGFTYEGDVLDASEPILFPIYTRPVRGRFNSEFVTTVFVMAKDTPVQIYGYDVSCLRVDPPLPPDATHIVGPEEQLVPDCNDAVGRLLWVEQGRSKDLAANVRVADVSQGELDHGVEIPVVRASELTLSRILLLGVPNDARFRKTLRIYGIGRDASMVNVQLGHELRQVRLTTTGDPYIPAYAEISDFPAPEAGETTITVSVQATSPGPLLEPQPVWAFVSVTNNETQRITTITPN
jgi:hypothetical protein